MTLNSEDRQAIEGLFSRLEEVERGAGPRDAEAEALIREKVARQPGSPYLMAQTIVMQDYALQEAQRRIEALERQAASRPAGGLFSGLFGGGEARRGGSEAAISRGGPATPMAPMQPGGGFLAGAAQTAMGVAGGVLLGNAIAGMFGGSGEAQAAESSPPAAEEAPAEEEGGFLDDFFGGDGEG